MSKAELTIEEQAANFWATYFCVCGDTDQTLDAFREIMGLFSDTTSSGAPFMNGDKRDAYVCKHGQGLTNCILYWLDAMGLIEHGVSIRWPWMTPLGAYVRNEVMNGTPEFFEGA